MQVYRLLKGSSLCLLQYPHYLEQCSEDNKYLLNEGILAHNPERILIKQMHSKLNEASLLSEYTFLYSPASASACLGEIRNCYRMNIKEKNRGNS